MVIRVVACIFMFFSSVGMCSELPDAVSPSSKKLRFFNLDLHISVIADVKDIFEALGHEVVDWSISSHTWVFGRNPDPVEVINNATWYPLTKEKREQFYARYHDFLSQFDGFIVTHACSFALLYEKFNKPIIVVSSTRYENPFTEDEDSWRLLDNFFRERVKANKAFIVANNKGDQHYFEYYTGIKPEHIPNLCLYTKCKYTGNRKGFIVRSFSDHMRIFTTDRLSDKDLIQNSQLPWGYPWSLLYDFQGIIHFPYNVSLMSIFEQYSANVPLFFPSKEYIRQLHNELPTIVLSDLSYYFLRHIPIPNVLNDPNNVNDPRVVDRWIDSCDFYDEENMPYVQYFDSIEHLEQLLQTADLREISKKMGEYNEKRRNRVFKQWRDLLERIIETESLSQ